MGLTISSYLNNGGNGVKTNAPNTNSTKKNEHKTNAKNTLKVTKPKKAVTFRNTINRRGINIYSGNTTNTKQPLNGSKKNVTLKSRNQKNLERRLEEASYESAELRNNLKKLTEESEKLSAQSRLLWGR
jgi:hypothetical protein